MAQENQDPRTLLRGPADNHDMGTASFIRYPISRAVRQADHIPLSDLSANTGYSRTTINLPADSLSLSDTSQQPGTSLGSDRFEPPPYSLKATFLKDIKHLTMWDIADECANLVFPLIIL